MTKGRMYRGCKIKALMSSQRGDDGSDAAPDTPL